MGGARDHLVLGPRGRPGAQGESQLLESKGAFDDKRRSSEKLASFSDEAGEASFSELFGVIEQSFL